MSNKWVKRISRALLPCFAFFVFSFSFAPKAHAVEFTGNISYGYQIQHYQNAPNWTDKIYILTNSSLPVVNGSAMTTDASARFNPSEVIDARLNLYPEQEFSGPVKLYASYYIGSQYDKAIFTESSNYWDTDAWQVTYINSYGQNGVVEGGLDKMKSFSANTGTRSAGVAIEASWLGTEGSPVRALGIRRVDGQGNINTGVQAIVTISYPSIRLITTEYTAEMEALDGMADAILEQNDILTAMKGDLVAILQDIYIMTGDMYIAQNLLNSYIEEMMPLLQSINANTSSIYNLLSTQLRLLETAIENAADSIEAAIAAQTAAMVAYLEQYFNTGNEVPDDTYQQQQDAENILDQMGSLEKPDVNTVVPEIGDYTDGGVSGVLGAIFSSNLIVTMMTLSASFAFGAYVLFGKRD